MLNGNPHIKLLASIGCALLLSGCGNLKASSFGGDSGMSGMVSAGPVSGATVRVYAINADGSQGVLLGSEFADGSGQFVMDVETYIPVLVVATGGSYVEESSGATVNLGNAKIRTVLPYVLAGRRVAVTPVTEIATQNALLLISSNSAADPRELIEYSNAAVGSALGLTDITLPPADPTQPADSAESAEAAKYALVLASISKLADNAGTTHGTDITSLDMMQALATAFAYNGNFNSDIGAVAVPVPNGANSVLDLNTVLGGATNFAPAMQAAMTAVAAVLPEGFDDPAVVPVPTFAINPSVPIYVPVFDIPPPPVTLPSGRPSDDGPPEPPPPPPTYKLGGTISGLSGTIVLKNKNRAEVSISSNGAFYFDRELFDGLDYSVTTYTHPTGQLCSLDHGDGTISGADVTTIEVNCISATTIQNGGNGAGNAKGSSIVVDSNGNMYVAGDMRANMDGLTPVGTSGNVFVTKYNSSFVRQWSVLGTSCGNASGIALDSSNNVYVTGNTCVALSGQTQHGSVDMFIAKYNSSGVLQWNIQDGGTGGLSGWGIQSTGIKVDLDDNVYVAGYTAVSVGGQTQSGTMDMFISKYDSSGSRLWIVQKGGPVPAGRTQSHTQAMSLAIDGSGGVYVGGYTDVPVNGQTPTGNSDWLVSKYDSDGVHQWTYLSGVAGEAHYGHAVVADSAGNIYVAGRSPSRLTFLASLDSAGVMRWNQDRNEGLNPQALAVGPDDSVYMLSSHSGLIDGQLAHGPSDFTVMKYHTDGTRQWTIQNGTNAITNPYGLATDLGGHFYVTGSSTGMLDGQVLHGQTDMFITRY